MSSICQEGHALKIAARRQQLGSGTGFKRNREKFFNEPAITNDRDFTIDPTSLKTLVCLERQQHDLIPDEYQPHKKKLSNRFGLVFIQDKIIVPKNLRATIISLLHKGHPAFNKMKIAARHFWWPRITGAIQKKFNSCIFCKRSGENIIPNLQKTETNNVPQLNNPNGENL